MVIYQAWNQARVTDRDTVEIKKSAKKKKKKLKIYAWIYYQTYLIWF